MSFDGVARAEPRAGDTALVGMTIVHEIPGRIRLRVPLVDLPMLDSGRLSHKLRTARGVTSVRLNPGAQSVVITHDGTEATDRKSVV